MDLPIILYGRLFEEERFQYISFIFGQHVFIIEISTEISDIQGRSSEAMYTLIRKWGGIPRVSLFVKILKNVAHIMAQINLQDETLTTCKSTPEDLEILDLNEINELIVASHYLVKLPLTWITENCVQTLFYKQPFLEGMCINKRIFGCRSPLEKGSLQSPYQIILVLCDTFTQSNFLWNNKPMTVTAKTLTRDIKDKAPNMFYQQIDLTQMNFCSNERGGVRFGDQILYDGPFDVVFD